MSSDLECTLTLGVAAFDRVREFAEAHDMDLADALELVVQRGVEDQERRDGVCGRLDALEGSLGRLHQLIDGLGPRVFAVARLLAARESLVTDKGIAEEDFLAAVLIMGRHEWEAFTIDPPAEREPGGHA